MANEYYWLHVSTDIYELPLYVADTAKELANHLGCDTSTVIQLARAYEKGELKKSHIRRVSRSDTQTVALDQQHHVDEILHKMIYGRCMNVNQIHEETGVSGTTIKAILKGDSEPRLSTLMKIAKACGYSRLIFME